MKLIIIVSLFLLLIPIVSAEEVVWTNTKTIGSTVQITAPQEFTTCIISPDSGSGWDTCTAYVEIQNNVEFLKGNSINLKSMWKKGNIDAKKLKYEYTTNIIHSTNIEKHYDPKSKTWIETSTPIHIYSDWKSSHPNINKNQIYAVKMTFEKLRWSTDMFDFSAKLGSVESILDPDVTACGTLNASNVTYTMTTNLTVTSGDCLKITGTNVTLLGNGYEINFGASGEGAAINAYPGNGVKIYNVSINQTSQSNPGYNDGILFESNSDGRAENVTIKVYGVNGYGISNLWATNVTLHNNTIASQDSYAIFSLSSNNLNITNNTITKSTDTAGMFLNGNTYDIIKYNNIVTDGSMDIGMYITSCSYENISENTIASGFVDIQLYTSSNINVTSNILTNGGTYGIYAIGGTKNNYTTNTINVAGYGIALNGGSTNSNFILNAINTTGPYAGIALVSSSNNNTLVDNGIVADTGYGIYVYSSHYNNITGGSIFSPGSYDYEMRNSNIDNLFNNTGFTTTRYIHFYDAVSVFEYDNGTGVWIQTNTSGALGIARDILSWKKTNVSWSDTSVSGTSATAKYNVTGLTSNTYYDVYNNSVFAAISKSDSNGKIPSIFAYLVSTPVTITTNIINSIPHAPTFNSSSTGNYYYNYSWIVNNAGMKTDTFNVTVNGTYTNGSTLTYINTSGMSPHEYQNISVRGYNSTYKLLGYSLTASNKLANNPITIGNISSAYYTTVDNAVTINPTYADVDNDIPLFGSSATKGVFYTNNGTFYWLPVIGDNGTYNWYINVTDNNGSTATKSFSFSLNSTTPGEIVDLTAHTGNFYINYTWNETVNTDTFNVSLNNVWTNGSALNYKNTVLTPHAWGNISVIAYNTSTGNKSSAVDMNTQIPNNAPTIGTTSETTSVFTVSESNTITVTNIADLDNDTMLFVKFGITHLGTESNYSASQITNTSTWKYVFSTNTPGIYTITHVYVSDNQSSNVSQIESIQFIVTSVTSSVGSASGYAPAPVPTLPFNASIGEIVSAPTLNIGDFPSTVLGHLILQIMTGFGAILFYLGFIRKDGKLSNGVLGILIFLLGMYGLGWSPL